MRLLVLLLSAASDAFELESAQKLSHNCVAYATGSTCSHHDHEHVHLMFQRRQQNRTRQNPKSVCIQIIDVGSEGGPKLLHRDQLPWSLLSYPVPEALQRNFHLPCRIEQKATRLLQVKQGRRSMTAPQPGSCREDPHCFQAKPPLPPPDPLMLATGMMGSCSLVSMPESSNALLDTTGNPRLAQT